MTRWGTQLNCTLECRNKDFANKLFIPVPESSWIKNTNKLIYNAMIDDTCEKYIRNISKYTYK